MERPNKTREEEYRELLPAEKALVKIAALMMCGRTLIPARLTAMTYGLEGRKVRFDVRRIGQEQITSERRYQFPAIIPGHYRAQAYP